MFVFTFKKSLVLIFNTDKFITITLKFPHLDDLFNVISSYSDLPIGDSSRICQISPVLKIPVVAKETTLYFPTKLLLAYYYW